MMRAAMSQLWRRATFLVLVVVAVSGCGGTVEEETDMEARPVDEVAAQFHGTATALIDELGIETESVQMRARRCEGKKGELSEEVYHVWVGVRGLARDSHVDSLIEAQHAKWDSEGWEITRYRHLDGGGVNLAATDPGTGQHFSLDSGFDEDPDAYLVGFFNTTCFRNPGGKVDFGNMDAPTG